MADTYSKREIYKKKLAKQREKAEKREFKKENNNKGKSFEEMIVYVDINGNFTDIPPHLQEKENEKKNKFSNRTIYSGVVTHINEKGYGFIKENDSNDSVFFHNKALSEPVQINDKVQFTKESRDRGFRALQVNKEY